MGFGLLFQEQNREVAKKLGFATLLMFTLPILAFFACTTFIFQNTKEPTMWAGGVAVLVTNIIVGGYVYSAFSEPDDEEDVDGHYASSSKAPRVGAFKKKERVD